MRWALERTRGSGVDSMGIDDGPQDAGRDQRDEPAGPTDQKRRGRGSAVALAGLVVLAAAAFGLIARDAGWLGETEDPQSISVPVSESAAPACAGTGSCATPARPTATPSESARVRPPARPAAGTRTGTGGERGTGGHGQAGRAREARDRYAPRPPTTPGIDQDELDQKRDEVESGIVPVPGDNGPVPTP